MLERREKRVMFVAQELHVVHWLVNSSFDYDVTRQTLFVIHLKIQLSKYKQNLTPKHNKENSVMSHAIIYFALQVLESTFGIKNDVLSVELHSLSCFLKWSVNLAEPNVNLL